MKDFRDPISQREVGFFLFYYILKIVRGQVGVDRKMATIAVKGVDRKT
jgi:hypothetical protein